MGARSGSALPCSVSEIADSHFERVSGSITHRASCCYAGSAA
jgi:hypothetical protein